MSRPTTLTMSLDVGPYREAFLKLCPRENNYVNSELFAIQILIVLLRQQLAVTVDTEPELVYYDNSVRELYHVVEHTNLVRSCWKAMRRTVLADPEYIVHDIQYRNRDKRFLIMGSYE